VRTVPDRRGGKVNAATFASCSRSQGERDAGTEVFRGIGLYKRKLRIRKPMPTLMPPAQGRIA
jgi:hypothetical protein